MKTASTSYRFALRSSSRRPAVGSLAVWLFIALPLIGSADEIHKAVSGGGSLSDVEAILRTDPAAVNTPDEFDRVPLILAIQARNPAMARLLLERGADPQASVGRIPTPLQMTDDAQIASLLLKHGADPDFTPAEGTRTPLQISASHTRLVDKKASARAVEVVKVLRDAGAYYDIESAICLKDEPRVRLLLKGNRHWAREKPGLLLIACETRSVPLVSLLIEQGADPNARNSAGIPVAHIAMQWPDLLRALLERGADAKISYGSAQNRDRWPPPPGFTLMHRAADVGDVESARLLLKHGTEVDARTTPNGPSYEGGETPLILAAEAARVEMVEFLLKNGANPKARTPGGVTPMRRAAESIEPDGPLTRQRNADYRRIIKLLKEAGAPLDLIAAIGLGDGELVSKLLKADPAQANATYPSGEQVLTRAVAYGELSVIESLLRFGAKADIWDSEGRSLLRKAREGGAAREVLDLLRKHGGKE